MTACFYVYFYFFLCGAPVSRILVFRFSSCFRSCVRCCSWVPVLLLVFLVSLLHSLVVPQPTESLTSLPLVRIGWAIDPINPIPHKLVSIPRFCFAGLVVFFSCVGVSAIAITVTGCVYASQPIC